MKELISVRKQHSKYLLNQCTSMKKFRTAIFVILLSTSAVLEGIAQVESQVTAKTIIFLCPPCDLDCDTMHFQKPGLCPTCGMKLFASYQGFENKRGDHSESCDKKVAVLLFPGVEIIDFAGPWEVFGAAGMNVFSVAANDELISAGMNMKIKPDYNFSNAPRPDILLVPGGNVKISDTATVNWIKKVSRKTEYTMSVCTGAFYLAVGGVLDDLKATTFFSAIPALKKSASKSIILDSVRFVDNGRIITSAGLSSGIDAALHLVAQYIGNAQTQKLANLLEYSWSSENHFVRGKLADRFTQNLLDVLIPFDYKLNSYDGDQKKWAMALELKTGLSQTSLRNLLTYQLEQTSGWKQTKKTNTWTIHENGKIWIGELGIRQSKPESYEITLKVRRG